MAHVIAEPDSAPVRRRMFEPSWIASVVLHVALLVTLVVSFPSLPRGTGFEPSRQVGLVLRADVVSDGEEYVDGPSAAATDEPVAAAADAEDGQPAIGRPAASDSTEEPIAEDPLPIDDLLNEPPPSDPSDVLPATSSEPAALDGDGPSPTADATTAQAPRDSSTGEKGADDLIGAGNKELSEELGLPIRGGVNSLETHGKARTAVFGVGGEGYKFVYVFDRSASMGGSGRNTLSAAKAELVRSLESLGDIHQFQIIFYNEDPVILDLAGPTRLVFGTEQNKALARRFIRGVTADGGTRHEDALLMALRLRPDVIFFLTDADEPAMTSEQLNRIHRLCEGETIINAIEFGMGPALAGENFLARLARENGGRYVYFDSSRPLNVK